jgi:hypothetical protein
MTMNCLFTQDPPPFADGAKTIGCESTTATGTKTTSTTVNHHDEEERQEEE